MIVNKLFQKQKKSVLVIDYNPEIIRSLIKKKVFCIYGDFANEEVLEMIGDIMQDFENIDILSIKPLNEIVIDINGDVTKVNNITEKYYSLITEYTMSEIIKFEIILLPLSYLHSFLSGKYPYPPTYAAHLQHKSLRYFPQNQSVLRRQKVVLLQFPYCHVDVC